MPSCKAGCVFGCWQLTGCRGTLLSLILSFLGPDAVLRCPRAPPAESAEIPEAPPPSADGVTEPLGPLEASSGEHSAWFSLLHKPATLLHCFPFIGTPSLFDFFSSTGCACFCLQTTSSPPQDEHLQALQALFLLQFFGTVHCRWDGAEELCRFQGMAWRPTGAAHCIKAAGILHHAVYTEPPMGARLQQALGQRVRGGCPPLNPDPDAVDVWVCSSRPRVTRRIPGRLCMPSHPPGRLCRCAEAPVI